MAHGEAVDQDQDQKLLCEGIFSVEQCLILLCVSPKEACSESYCVYLINQYQLNKWFLCRWNPYVWSHLVPYSTEVDLPNKTDSQDRDSMKTEHKIP